MLKMGLPLEVTCERALIHVASFVGLLKTGLAAVYIWIMAGILRH